jgi:hypothetical protein
MRHITVQQLVKSSPEFTSTICRSRMTTNNPFRSAKYRSNRPTERLGARFPDASFLPRFPEAAVSSLVEDSELPTKGSNFLSMPEPDTSCATPGQYVVEDWRGLVAMPEPTVLAEGDVYQSKSITLQSSRFLSLLCAQNSLIVTWCYSERRQ